MTSTVTRKALRSTMLTKTHATTHRFRAALKDRRQRLALWECHEVTITLHIRRRKAAYHFSDGKFPLTITLRWAGCAHSEYGKRMLACATDTRRW